MPTRRLRFQCLERRYTLAGDVTAIVIDGDLFLTGDASANELNVGRLSSGDMEITGLAGTTINGSSSFPIVISGMTGDIHADLFAGDDDLELDWKVPNGADLPGSVLVNLGSGNDHMNVHGPVFNGLQVGTLEIAGSLIVHGRDGNDTFEVNRAITAGDPVFYGGDGNDDASILGNFNHGNQVGGQILVDLSTGDDTLLVTEMRALAMLVRDPIGITTGAQVTVNDLQVAGTIEMYLSVQDDTLSISGTPQNTIGWHPLARDLVIHTGNGDDQVTIAPAFVRTLTLYTGFGNEGGGFYGVSLIDVSASEFLFVDTAEGLDNVLLQGVFTQQLFVGTGDDSDGVIVLNCAFGFAVIDSGFGGDVVGIHSSQFTELYVTLWLGDDLLVVATTGVQKKAQFDGHDGTDQFVNVGGNIFGDLTTSSF